MTWAELHGVLRARGLVRADDGAARATPAAGFVTGIAYDSRTVEPGKVFVALKGLHADGARSRAQAIERGALAVVSEQPPRRRRRACRGPSSTDARLALALLAAAFYRPSERRDAGRRHHRHQRQDDDGVPGRRDLRSGRHPLRHARHRRLPDRRRGARGDPHDAGSAGGAAPAARDGDRGLRRLRDGSVVARAVAAAGRRHARSPPACSRT